MLPVVLGASLALALPSAAPAARPQEGFVFASGPDDSSYQALALALREEVERACPSCPLRVVPSQGSYENAARLRSGAADVAILQSDVAFLEHFEDRSFRAVAPLFTEPIHVLVRRELGLERLSDLRTVPGALQVAIGAEGSGTASNALTVLEELRAGEDRFVLHRIGLSEAMREMTIREMDVVFLTAAPPVRSLLPTAHQRIFDVLEIDGDIARRMARKYPFFFVTEVPYEAYGTRGRNVTSLGPETLLVVGSGATPDLVAALFKGLEAIARDAVQRGVPQLAGWSPGMDLDRVPIPLHETARRLHAARVDRLGRWLRESRGYVLPILILVTPLLVLLRFSRIAYFIHQYVLGRIFCLLVAVWLLGAAAMHLIEGAKNSSFRSFGQSAIAILHYLFSGLESKYPITLAGNVVAILMLTLGVGIVTLFTATLVTLLVERALEVRRIRPKPWRRLRLKDHVIVVGWSERAERVLAQLRSPDLPRKPVVVVVARGQGEKRPETRRPYRDTWLVEGDVANADTLARADADSASCALVLSAEETGICPDRLSVARTFAIASVRPDLRTVVEAQAGWSIEHLERVGADEIVEPRLLGERMLSQCVITPGIARIYAELLTFGRDSQEIYVLELPAFLRGLGFSEIRGRLARHAVIPVGYHRAGDARVVLNPRDPEAAGVPLAAGDRLVVVADEPVLHERPPRASRWRDPVASGARRRPSGFVRGRRVRVGIAAWNERARELVEQLAGWARELEHELSVVVFSASAAGPRPTVAGARISHVPEDPRTRSGLERGGVAELDCLVVAGARDGDRSDESVDHESLLVCLAASQLRPDLHLVVEILDPKSRDLFARLPGAEVVSTGEIAEKLLAQAAISPGIVGVYMELLTATEDSNEIYLARVPQRWIGATFQEALEELSRAGEPVLPLGYRALSPETGLPVVVINPGLEPGRDDGVVDWRGHELAAGDSLIVMAYDQPDW